ncbi:MAG: hypothetical protein ACYC5A_11040 [Thermoleophilia bacterium]
MQELLQIAQLMIEGTENLILGCREIDRLRFETDFADDPLFHQFTSVASETEKFPFGEVRSRYSEDYLSRIDKEMDDYLKDMEPFIIDSCHKLVVVLKTRMHSH